MLCHRTPLLLAICMADTKLVRKLLGPPYIVDINNYKVAGGDALSFSMLRERSFAIFQYLLQLGANPRGDLGRGRSALVNACQNAQYEHALAMLPFSDDPDIHYKSRVLFMCYVGEYRKSAMPGRRDSST